MREALEAKRVADEEAQAAENERAKAEQEQIRLMEEEVGRVGWGGEWRGQEDAGVGI